MNEPAVETLRLVLVACHKLGDKFPPEKKESDALREQVHLALRRHLLRIHHCAGSTAPVATWLLCQILDQLSPGSTGFTWRVDTHLDHTPGEDSAASSDVRAICLRTAVREIYEQAQMYDESRRLCLMAVAPTTVLTDLVTACAWGDLNDPPMVFEGFGSFAIIEGEIGDDTSGDFVPMKLLESSGITIHRAL